jgi:tetratricopeptide (TPR) repeat protein
MSPTRRLSIKPARKRCSIAPYLTYRHWGSHKETTDEWRRVKTIEEAEAIAKRARSAQPGRAPKIKVQCRKPSPAPVPETITERNHSPVPETITKGPVPETITTSISPGVGPLSDRGDDPTPLSLATPLADGAPTPESAEAGVAYRAAGMTCWFVGQYREARDHFEKALALFQPGRDDDLAFRFAHDEGVAAMIDLAFVSWPLGEVDRALTLIDRAEERIADLTHIGTHAYGKFNAGIFRLMRGDRVLWGCVIVRDRSWWLCLGH